MSHNSQGNGQILIRWENNEGRKQWVWWNDHKLSSFTKGRGGGKPCWRTLIWFGGKHLFICWDNGWNEKIKFLICDWLNTSSSCRYHPHQLLWSYFFSLFISSLYRMVIYIFTIVHHTSCYVQKSHWQERYESSCVVVSINHFKEQNIVVMLCPSILSRNKTSFFTILHHISHSPSN